MIVCLDVSGNESAFSLQFCLHVREIVGDLQCGSKICIKLPNGIMLADLFEVRQKKLFMGEKVIYQ